MPLSPPSPRPLIAYLCLAVQVAGAVFLAVLVALAVSIRQRQIEIDRKVDAAIRAQAEIRAFSDRQSSENRAKIDALIEALESP